MSTLHDMHAQVDPGIMYMDSDTGTEHLQFMGPCKRQFTVYS